MLCEVSRDETIDRMRFSALGQIRLSRGDQGDPVRGRPRRGLRPDRALVNPHA